MEIIPSILCVGATVRIRVPAVGHVHGGPGWSGGLPPSPGRHRRITGEQNQR